MTYNRHKQDSVFGSQQHQCFMMVQQESCSPEQNLFKQGKKEKKCCLQSDLGEPLQFKIVIQNDGCKCSKIGCLKLYCQCFNQGILCGKHCDCMGCQNCKGNQKRIQTAQQMANFRKPGTFIHIQTLPNNKKCSCKKSNCQKKYCQCFSNGTFCGPSCQCLGCGNKDTTKPQILNFKIPIKVKS